MYLKRSLIKRQAKDLIRGNVFKLFIITFIVTLCVSAVSSIFMGITNVYRFSHWNDVMDDYFDDGFEDYFEDYFDNYFGDYGSNDEGNDFFNFGKTEDMSLLSVKNEAVSAEYNFMFSIANRYAYIPFIITALLSPLEVALMGFYVCFIRGKRFEFDNGLRSVFSNAFKSNYPKKLGVYVLRMAVMGLLMMLFFIPGIIFSYSSYFAFQIMCDYPELSPWEAIKLSKKIVRGNRFELFVMNLSFLPWSFLCIFIFPIIYLMPYFGTTNALYYENFRLRAIQQGRVTEDDFLSASQRCAKYGGMGNTQYYSPEGPTQGTYYQSAPQPQPPYRAQYYSAPNQQYQQYTHTYAPDTPPVQPQQAALDVSEAPAEPQKAPCEEPKPAEPTDYPWEGQ